MPSILIFEGLSQLLLNTIYPMQSDNQDIVNSISFLSIGMISAFLLIAIYRKYIDKASFFSMGFSTKDRLFDFMLGMSLGTILIFIGFIFLIAIGNLEISSIQFDYKIFFGYIILMLLVSLHEEVLVRGYLLNTLMSVSNKYLALFISSILFAALHLMNPGITTISFINIVLAGILLGISYVHSKNLWFPMALHFSWNFFQGPVLGFEVSGQEIQSILTQQISGNDIITGGKFGFEGSIIASVLLVISIVLINWFFINKEALTQKITIDFSKNKLTFKEE
jgi:membrane protease YdiL (CAAX protease family)